MRGMLLSLLLLVLPPALLPAQQLRFSFNHLTTNNGLLSNGVNAVARDEKGFIWLGTNHGLQRYDGSRFLNFKHDPKDPRTIPSHVIGKLHRDRRRDRLWLMSKEGQVGIFDTRKLLFQRTHLYVDSQSVDRLNWAHFHDDERGNVFVLDKQLGLFVWSESRGRFFHYTFPAPAGRDWRVSGIAHRPGTDEYLLCFPPHGFFKFHVPQGDWESGKTRLEVLSLPDFPQGGEAYNLFVDRQDRLWLQHWPVYTPLIYCYDLGRRTTLLRANEPILLTGSYLETSPFFQSRDGAIWLYGANLFARYDEAERVFRLVHNGYVDSRSIQYRTVTTLFEDREQTMWVGTNDNGVFTFNPGREYFRTIGHYNHRLKQTGHGSPTDFLELDDGTVLVSVWDDGLYRYDRHWNELPIDYSGDRELTTHNIWSMCPSREPGIVWLSTQSGRVIRYDQRKRTAKTFFSKVEWQTIRQLVEDRGGDLWLGMHRTGIFRWRRPNGGPLSDLHLERFEQIPDCRVSKMIIDARGRLWAGTETQGLYVIDPAGDSVVLHFHPSQADPQLRFPDVAVSSVLEYNDSLVFISGPVSLHVYNRRRHQLSELLPSGTTAGYITELARDGSGHLWVSTTSGLYRVNIRTGALLSFGRRDGIEDDNFTTAASGRLSDGRLLFGASEHFVVFDPQVFDRAEKAGEGAMITELYVNNRPVLVDSVEEAGGLRLSHRESTLSVVFSTLQFHRSQRIRYKMEGLDPDWQTNEQNIAVYSFLPVGTYQLLLQPVYSDGALGPIRTLSIQRDPPFWQAWWFYSLLLLLSGWIVYLFDRERRRRRESVLLVREKMADNLHTEVKTALNSIHILSEIAGVKARKDPAGATDYLEQIKGRSQKMMVAMEDILWTLAPENDSMEKVVERIEDYVQQLNAGSPVGVDLLIEPALGSLRLEMGRRQLLLRLVRETLDMLLRSGAGALQVHLGRKKTQLTYTIEFEKGEMDLTVFTNLIQRREMAALLADLGAEQQLEMHRSRGFLSFAMPVE